MKKLTKPYSDNIIFLDTEFSTNDPKTAELLSIGMVKISGQELYLEINFNGEPSGWVKKNVLPHLKGKTVSKAIAVQRIKKFIGIEKPYPIAFINFYDMVLLYRFLGSIRRSPFAWPPIDFASMLFANGFDPETYYRDDENNFFDEIGIDIEKFNAHSALDDANLLREVYLKLTK